MPRKKQLKQRHALFVNLAVVPAEARPKGKTPKGVLVTIVKETAKFVTLRYDIPKRGRAKTSRAVIFDIAKELVVLYDEEVIEIEPVEAPAPAVPAKKAPPKKKAPAKKAAASTGKRRGRPSKKEEEAPAAPKKRGRPSKKKEEAPAPKKRGRPRKNKSISEGKEEAPTKRRKPGRPKKKSTSKKAPRKMGSVKKKPQFKLDPEDD